VTAGQGEWTLLGKITLLQIQTGVLTGQGSYDTSMLVPVETLRLTPDGVLGLVDGEWATDRHHRQHPAANHWRAKDTLSFGFTSHYDLMWNLFRRTPLGIAGENVIVVADQMINLDDIAGGMRIETDAGRVELTQPGVLEPCLEFTRFMTSRPDASAREVKPDREKLRNGVRGYAVGIPGPDAVDVRPGDAVSARAV